MYGAVSCVIELLAKECQLKKKNKVGHRNISLHLVALVKWGVDDGVDTFTQNT